MNAKIVIPISVIITIVIVVFSLTQIETVEEGTGKIDSMLQQIKEDKIKNDNSKDAWNPNDREWIQAGPFQIDRSEYLLGEKIFVNIINLNKNAKGTMVFTKIVNSTHVIEYKKINFDGSKPQQNFYLGISLSERRGICTADQLIGDWQLRFIDPNGGLLNLDFKIKNQIVPGHEKKYEAIC